MSERETADDHFPIADPTATEIEESTIGRRRLRPSAAWNPSVIAAVVAAEEAATAEKDAAAVRVRRRPLSASPVGARASGPHASRR